VLSWITSRRALNVELLTFAAYMAVAALAIVANGSLARWAVSVGVLGLLGLHWTTTGFAYVDGWSDAKVDTARLEREQAAANARDRGEIE